MVPSLISEKCEDRSESSSSEEFNDLLPEVTEKCYRPKKKFRPLVTTLKPSKRVKFRKNPAMRQSSKNVTEKKRLIIPIMRNFFFAEPQYMYSKIG
jgi:hypothetical protein